MGTAKPKKKNLKLYTRYVFSQQTYAWVSLTHVSLISCFFPFPPVGHYFAETSFTTSRFGESLSLSPFPGAFANPSGERKTDFLKRI